MGDNSYDYIDTRSDINDDTDDVSDGTNDTTDTSADTEGTDDVSSDNSTNDSSDTDSGDYSDGISVESSDDYSNISDTDGFEYTSETLFDYSVSEDDDSDDSNDTTAKVDDIIIEENDIPSNDVDEFEEIEDVIIVDEDTSDTDEFKEIENILIVEEDDVDEEAEEKTDIIIEDQLTIDDWLQYRDYVRYTPKNYGTWESGVRGDGFLIPDDNPELAEKLKTEYGIDGLEYDLGKLDTDCVSLMDFELSEEDAEIADRDTHRAMVIQGLADILTRYEDEYVLDEFDEEVDEHLDEEEKAEAERIYDLIGEKGLTELYEGRVPPEIDIHHDNEKGCMRVIESDIHKYFHHKGGYAEHSIKDNTEEET